MRLFHIPLITTTLALALVAACGDNDKRYLYVDTQVASNSLTAGERVDARCTIVDAKGQPALDPKGNPLADSTDLVVSYESIDSFSTDADGAVIAAKIGTANVRCSAPSLALVDADPETITITAGAAVRVITRLDQPTTFAGQPDGVTCVAFDAFDNPVTGFAQSIALSPSGAGTNATSSEVTATLAGEYEVSCVVMGAADVTSADLFVLPSLPATIAGVLDPERTLYAIYDQVTLIVDTFDKFGNRVDDVALAYSSSPTVPSPSLARFQFAQDGTFFLTGTVTSPTQDNAALSVTLPAVVDTAGPTIDCRRIDAPSQSSDAYMVQQAPANVQFPVHISDSFQVQSVTINGQNATFDSSSDNYVANVGVGFGMNFVDVVATDQFGKQNSTTCFFLAAQYYSSESSTMAGTVGLRLDPYAVGDPDPTGLNSLNDLFYTVMGSSALRTLVDQGLTAANPISSGGCGIFACNPNVNYNSNSINWNRPSTTLSLINGGLRATVYMPNVRLTVNACGTTCCIGGSTIQVSASYVSASVDFSLSLQGGVLRAGVATSPSVSVGTVTLNGSGFCGFIINLVQSFFTGTVKNAIHDALVKFINSDVGPMLDRLVSSVDINTLAQSFAVPKLDGTGNITLGFGLAFTSFDATPTRALLGIGTRFTPGAIAQNRPSLGIPRRTSTPLLDPPFTSNSRPVGISAYEGLLNEVLHGLWRGGYFQANLSIGGGTAVIDGRLPPVAAITPGNTAQLMLGGISATVTIPGVINNPLPIVFGGRANATVSMNGNALTFGNFQLVDLYVSFQTSLSQSQRDALESFLQGVLQDVLASAINNGLPAFPIPSFTLPASVAQYGLPAGKEMGIVNPVLTTSGSHCVLDGGFGVR